MILFKNILKEHNTYTGNEISNYIKSITPNIADIPDYFIDTYINPNDGWKLKSINLKSLFNDENFKEYYDNYEKRYSDDEVNEEDLYNPLVVYKNELLDGYSRATELLKAGEKKVDAFVLESI